jgi:hypothetical protein
VGAVHYTDLDCIHIALAVEALVQENRFEFIKIEKKYLSIIGGMYDGRANEFNCVALAALKKIQL